MVTALIVTKLWLTARGAEKRVGTRMRGTARAAQRAVAIIVESGLLYLVTQAAFVVLSAIVPISGALRVELEGRSSITYKFGRADQLNRDPTKDGR